MLVLWIFQAAVGAAALAATLFASISFLRRKRMASYPLALAGAFSFVFFVSLPHVPLEMILVSLLVMAAAALLMPVENARSTSELLDDLDIGDSTATRRLKR